jgi:hypothetical protein
MLTRVDRVQLAVPDLASAAAGWVELLGAEPAGEDRVACLGARRSRYRLGDGQVELLEPDGAGAVQEAVAARGAHLFAAGAATGDLDALVAHLRGLGVEPAVEAGQAHVDPAASGIGLRVVLSPDEALEPVGDVAFLYEVTLLAADASPAVDRCAELFALDAGAFVPIESKVYGYAGTLTLFHPDRLGRFEVITPNDPRNTMGRFFARAGAGSNVLYMAFAESPALAAIEERARARGAGFTAVPPPDARPGVGADTVFLHPPALGGMMLGLSRPTMAWQWSGHPERVEPAR